MVEHSEFDELIAAFRTGYQTRAQWYVLTTDEGGLLMCDSFSHSDCAVLMLFSSLDVAKAAQSALFSDCHIEAIPSTEFMADVMPMLAEDGIHLGLDWQDGENYTDVTVPNFKSEITASEGA